MRQIDMSIRSQNVFTRAHWALLVAICMLAASRLRADEYFVSPSGDDSNRGSKAKPFASLERARGAVRAQKQLHPNRDYKVKLRGGVYHLNHTVEFGPEDSAAPGRTITYEAFRDEKPVFSSGVEISGWQKEGKWWTAPMPANLKTFLTLYDADGRLQRARGPAFSPTMDWKTGTNLDLYTLPLPKGSVKNWPNLGDVEIVIRPNYGWVLNILPLESVDEAAGMARTAIPASYPMLQIRFGKRGINDRGTAWVENALEFLNGPGQWVVNTQERKVYLWPRTEKPAHIEAPQLTELIRIEGQINYDGPRDEPVRGLRFKGISFTRGDRWPWEKDRIGWDLQHDWEMFDRPTALVRLRGTEDIRFEHCRWFDSGGAGIRMDLYAQSNRVTDSVLEHLGGTGILLAGYGPGTKDVNHHNEISRNHLHHLGEILWHAAAITVFQSGENHIAHNLIHDLNYSGIVVSTRIGWSRKGVDKSHIVRWRELEQAAGEAIIPRGDYFPSWELREPFQHGRNNLIEQNEIHDIMQKLWDGDAVYISGTGKGNWIRENFIHDCLSPCMCEGIRCDDDQCGTIIERNVILRNGGLGTGLCIKGPNTLLNNFVVDTDGDFLLRGIISLEGPSMQGSVIERNIEVASEPGIKPFFLKNLFGSPDPRFSETKTDYNLFWHRKDPHWADAHLAEARKEGAELHSMVGDPLFRDPNKGDFRFKPGSPAPKLGIEPIDLRKVGLR